jgi:YegS/Rv2252/BmrU family lipid kinase
MSHKSNLEASAQIRTSLIYNPYAGSINIEPLLPDVLGVLQQNNCRVEVRQTRQPGDIQAFAKEAADQGAQFILVAGGDGSINEAVNALAFSTAALGVIPVGTGNVWARQIGLPLPSKWNPHRLTDAVQQLLEGNIHEVDLGKAGERYFLMWSGVGLDAEVSAGIEPKPIYMRRLGLVGYAAYVVNVALGYRGTYTTIEVDGKVVATRALLAVISNVNLYAAILKVAPKAQLDDGLLNVSIFKGDNVLSALWHIPPMLTGWTDRDSRAIQILGRKITIRALRVCNVHVDGDPLTKTPISIEVVPGSLRVIVPPNIPAGLLSRPPVVRFAMLNKSPDP